MKATALRSKGSSQPVLAIRGFRLAAWERASKEGTDEGPTPEELLAASLAGCTAMTMEAYAKRKGWELGDVVVEVDYEPAQRGAPTRCDITVRLPESLPEDQRDRLMQVAAKSPVHRTLEGEIMFEERLELSSPEGTAADGNGARRRPLSTWWRRGTRRSDEEALLAD